MPTAFHHFLNTEPAEHSYSYTGKRYITCLGGYAVPFGANHPWPLLHKEGKLKLEHLPL